MAQVKEYKSILVKTCEYYGVVFQNNFFRVLNKNKKNLLDLDIIQNIVNIEELKQVYQQFGEYDFELNYSYNFLFNINNFDETIELINNGFFNDYLNLEDIDFLSTILEKPTLKKDESKIELKFSKIIKNVNGDKVKSPVILVFYLDEKFIQIKLRRLPEKFNLNIESNYYLDTLEEIKKWSNNYLHMLLISFDIFHYSVELFKNSFYQLKGLENISPVSFSCNNRNNGTIKLRQDKDNIMPVLNDLKKIGNDFESQKDKKLLEEYLAKLLNEADYYKIYLEWSWSYGKTRKKRVTYHFNRKYDNSEETLIYIEANKIKTKEKEDVVKFVSKYRKNFNEINQ